MNLIKNTKRLKVLFFSQRFPLPMDTGGKIRTGKMLEKLKEHFDITLLCNLESPKDDPYLGQVKDLCNNFQYVSWKEVPKYSLQFYAKVLIRSFFPYPVTVRNDYSRDLEIKITQLVQQRQFDLLICDFLQPTLNFCQVMQHPTLLFQHNVESMIVKRHYDAVKNPFMKVFWFIQWWKMVRFERHMCQQFDAVVAVSEQDRLVFERDFGVKNVYAIPTGVDTTFFSPNGMKPRENSLVYVGAMDWLPNEDAIVFFAQYILPYVRAAIPNVTLDIVGRNPSNYIQRILEEYPEITIVGRVEDVRPYISQQSVFVLPLRIGGGTRIKVYEAMAMGKPIVSTRVGAEGLPVEHGKHLLLADQPEEFAESVVYLLRDPIARNELGRSAREFVETRCGWNGVVQRFASICSQVVTSRPSRPQVHGEMR